MSSLACPANCDGPSSGARLTSSMGLSSSKLPPAAASPAATTSAPAAGGGGGAGSCSNHNPSTGKPSGFLLRFRKRNNGAACFAAAIHMPAGGAAHRSSCPLTWLSAAEGAGGSESPSHRACCFGSLTWPASLANGRLILETGGANLVLLALATGGPNITDIGKLDLETGGPTTVNGVITDNGTLAASAEGTRP